MLRQLSRMGLRGRMVPTVSLPKTQFCFPPQHRFMHVQLPCRAPQTGKVAANHAEAQHRAELTEEYADLETDEPEGEEYYIDCTEIDQRWGNLPYEAQQDMISYLNVKQEFGWMYLSHDEKRAIYYIAYGKWGPRDQATMNMAESVFKLMTSGLLFAAIGFTLINYAKDKEVVEMLDKEEALDLGVQA